MSINYVPRTWVTGEIVTAAYMNNEVRDPFTSLQAAFTGFTPSLTGSVTNPAVGNGTAVGRYAQQGKKFDFYGTIIFGTTSTFGSGVWSLVLPFITATANVTNLYSSFLTHYIGAAHSIGSALQVNTNATNAFLMYGTQPAANGIVAVAPTTPFTWAATHILAFSGTVESA